MSREIKFRAWDKKTERFQSGFHLTSDGKIIFACLVDNEDYILSQFTGLKDKNGKEIFENDIVCWTFDEKTKKEIVFHEGCFGHFNFMGINNEYPEFIPIHKKRAEYMIVCGNIFQNPELLGGENE
jgi:uncharacterized phage protein (TIGR01671 family)